MRPLGIELGLRPRKAATLGEDFEIDQYIHAFATSSDRVRYVILISAVASVLVFAAFWNSKENSWWNVRSRAARTAVRNQVWDNLKARLEICYKKGPNAAGFSDPCEDIEQISGWLPASRHGKQSLEAHLSELEKVRANDILMVSVPFLGIRFDINDLGAFSAIGLAMICTMLCFAMARQHENLYLCLWKVRRIAERERLPDDGESRANFLYHSLAMAQVFTRPPTLSRWKPRLLNRLAARGLLFVPVAVQSLILFYDAKTFWRAWGLNSRAAVNTMALQIVFFTFMVGSIIIAFLYSRAADQRWRRTFFAINPTLLDTDQPSWWEWVKVSLASDFALSVDGTGSLYVTTAFKPLGLPPRTVWRGWRISNEKSITPIASNEMPEEVQTIRDSNGEQYGFRRDDQDSMALFKLAASGSGELVVGGKRGVVDGVAGGVGFGTVGTWVLGLGDTLYVTDDGCVRKIELTDGAVSTIGGRPLAGLSRPRRPRLLGLAIDGSDLLIADYDYRCIRRISLDGKEQRVFPTSRWWSPIGVSCHNGTTYVLEHRRPSFWGTFLGLIGVHTRLGRTSDQGKVKPIIVWWRVDSPTLVASMNSESSLEPFTT
jgi:hypothetical protein